MCLSIKLLEDQQSNDRLTSENIDLIKNISVLKMKGYYVYRGCATHVGHITCNLIVL